MLTSITMHLECLTQSIGIYWMSGQGFQDAQTPRFSWKGLVLALDVQQLQKPVGSKNPKLIFQNFFDEQIKE